MPALRKFRKLVSGFLLLAAATLFVSCASEKPPLVDDPDTKHETMMPWNKQETWETSGQMSGVTDHR